ncbi:MAG TPA: GNAT family N-acetyltransferase [Mycobacteriales bacterium]
MDSPLDAVAWPVRTERLVLRPATPADSAAVWSYRQQEPVSRWLVRAPRTLADFRAYFDSPEGLAKTLVVERDGGIIGDLMVAVGDAWAQEEVKDRARGLQAELGWVLDPAHEGHGYATEAVRALLRICFTDLGLHRVEAGCFAANEPSWRLMERVGMRRESYTRRDALHRSGQWMDGMAYGILAEEWREQA